MPSTLTAGGKDGKQSKKIERNTLKVDFIEILLLWVAAIVVMIARGLSTAQLEDCDDAPLSTAMLYA
ncbi:hypothetical protein [Pseudomonas sp. GL-B-19]|uniref:hypothetical protein n=1 Tax=Pseudomonas sp. GL-B-19 TaxID=2832393 RepID=UPI001CC199F7|nr:hypothetical protein [Pseudomonas sp. GL-B-19]